MAAFTGMWVRGSWGLLWKRGPGPVFKQAEAFDLETSSIHRTRFVSIMLFGQHRPISEQLWRHLREVPGGVPDEVHRTVPPASVGPLASSPRGVRSLPDGWGHLRELDVHQKLGST